MDVTRVLIALVLCLCRCVLGMQRIKEALLRGNAVSAEHVKDQ
jgi:hypothetical protein